jgi:iron complex transport system substrate-binding protein
LTGSSASGFATERPQARQNPKVGGYISVDLENIKDLNTDLHVAFSGSPAQITRDLVQQGFAVFTTNQRTLRGILDAILMLGSVVGAPDGAHKVVEAMRRTMGQILAHAAFLQRRREGSSAIKLGAFQA